MESKVDEFQKSDVTITTFSPYILNYVNRLLTDGVLDYGNLEATEIGGLYPDNESARFDLKIKNEGVHLIDTSCMSEPMEWIYSDFPVGKARARHIVIDGSEHSDWLGLASNGVWDKFVDFGLNERPYDPNVKITITWTEEVDNGQETVDGNN